MNQLDLGPLVDRWRLACTLAQDEGGAWAESESALLLQSILAASQSSSSPELQSLETGPNHGDQCSAVDRATRSWARLQPTLAVLTLRLRSLREVIAAYATEDRRAEFLDNVCGLVDATANEEFTLRLQRAALTDPLTGVGNRRALDNAWQVAVTQGKRLGQPVCLVGIDLDGLKRINDFQGHAAGDDAIIRLCASLRAALRDTDDIFRIGGDEFVALLPGTAAEAAGELAARVQHYHAPKFSWGAADTIQDGSTLDDVLRCADQRLYAQRRRDRSATASVTVKVATPQPSWWSRVTPRQALELGTSGALALAIGAVVVSISGGQSLALRWRGWANGRGLWTVERRVLRRGRPSRRRRNPARRRRGRRGTPPGNQIVLRSPTPVPSTTARARQTHAGWLSLSHG